MVTPFNKDELFEVSSNLTPERQGDFVIVDNYYKNYEALHDLLQSMPVPNWKMSDITRNYKDYYDCRPMVNNSFYSPSYERGVRATLDIIYKVYGLVMRIQRTDFEFNYFKHINLPEHEGMQMHPHSDNPIAGIVYLDKICSGGTAVYPELDYDFQNHEEDNLLYDVSSFKKYVMPAKPNRLVLFPAEVKHGGYIEDHSKYLKDWRINQIMFFTH